MAHPAWPQRPLRHIGGMNPVATPSAAVGVQRGASPLPLGRHMPNDGCARVRRALEAMLAAPAAHVRQACALP